MTSIDYARRRARGGQKKLPANPKQWPFEHNALDVREDLGIRLDIALPHEQAYTLLPNVQIMRHGDVFVAECTVQYFRGAGVKMFSGLATRMDDGTEIVLYNDAHSPQRVRATLMEEFFHIRLDHPRSSVRLLPGDARGHRTFNGDIEEEAYASGAAALVPYAALRQLIEDGLGIVAIARIFDVSNDLVSYRLKVTKLFSKLRRGS